MSLSETAPYRSKPIILIMNTIKQILLTSHRGCGLMLNDRIYRLNGWCSASGVATAQHVPHIDLVPDATLRLFYLSLGPASRWPQMKLSLCVLVLH